MCIAPAEVQAAAVTTALQPRAPRWVERGTGPAGGGQAARARGRDAIRMQSSIAKPRHFGQLGFGARKKYSVGGTLSSSRGEEASALPKGERCESDTYLNRSP